MINAQEILAVVDEQDRELETLPRSEVHQRKLLHRISHIWLVNEQGQVLCQKRSMLKDTWPGSWECWFGGHVLAGQSYLETAISETKEELGLSVSPSELHEFGKKRSKINEQENILTTVYALQQSLDTSKMRLEVEEVELVKWFGFEELEKIFKVNDPAWNKFGFELEMLAWLKTEFKLS